MGRPRTISDVDALALARACIVEHGPGVSLSVLSRAIGLSPPSLLKRFESKEQLVFQALLPTEPPQWVHTLAEPPGPEPVEQLAGVLLELCEGFEAVGPALAALRMSPVAVGRVFPPTKPGPAVAARRLMAQWLRAAGVKERVDTLADALVGAAEARGFLTWVGPQMVDDTASMSWARELAALALSAEESSQ